MNKTLLSIGHGYSARALSPHLLKRGWTVIGTTRTQEKAVELKQQGVEPVVWPNTDLAQYFETATHILTSVSPQESGDPVLQSYSKELQARKDEFEWVGYLSTTGVYGDHKGSWVDEESPLSPSTKRGELRKIAEKNWSDLNLPLHIFRLAGIYGPGRGPFAKVRSGLARRIIKKGQVFSRIHREDIATILLASIDKPRKGAIYNVCDDDPAPPQDVIAYAAELLNLPIPKAEDFELAEMTPMARSFYAESKKVRNDLIKDELGVKLKYPNYKIGLEKLLELSNKK